MHKKFFVLVSAVLAGAVILSGCTAKTDGPAEEELSTAGIISAAVPDGYEFKAGSLINEDDECSAWIIDEEDALHYIYISAVESEEEADEDIALTKDLNQDITDVEDINLELDDTSWSGIAYDFEDEPCTHLKATLDDGTVVTVQTYEFDREDETFHSILDSIQVNRSEEEADTEVEPAETIE